ncbi:hypothetical protein [Bombilactobacillus thymidiniphilus]|nr:hypothetical protein [Bombilactobacillus thymidiniphilus]
MQLNFNIAQSKDYNKIIDIYNQDIASKKSWFASFDPHKRPL